MSTGHHLYHRIVQLRATRRKFGVCTVVKTSGSVPQKPGAKMLVMDDGTIEGTIGGGAIEYAIIRQAREALDTGKSALITHHLTHELAMCCGGGMTVFVDVQKYSPSLYLFGCGHIGAPLARYAAECGFDVQAVDGRAGFTDIEVERLAVTLHYDSADEAVGAAFAGGPVALAYSRFDSQTRDEAHAEYLQSIAAFRDGDEYDVPGEFVVIRGCKT